MKTVTVDYCGVRATGRTVKEAKQDAARRIKRFAENEYRYPAVYRHKGHTLIVFDHLTNGQGYTIIYADCPDGRVHSSCGLYPDDDATAVGVKHLLDITRAPEEYDIPAWAEGLLDVQETIRDWMRADRFNLEYRAAIERGLTDTQAHQHACTTMYQPDDAAAARRMAAEKAKERRNAAARAKNQVLRDLCGTSAAAARRDMGM